MSERVVLQDGVIQPDGRVSLDADEQTLLLGRGVFETLRTYGGKLFGLEAHLLRLRNSASGVGVPFPGAELLAAELQATADGIQGDAVVRVTLTHGGHRIIRATPLAPVLPSYRCATRIWTPTAWLDGALKHTSRANSVLAVEAAGVDEVIWVDPSGHMLEGTRSNVFAVMDGVLCTPALDGRLLAGITRAALLHAAQAAGIPTTEGLLHKDGLFDELYLSSTLKELCPITELDGQPAPGGGSVGAAAAAAFRERVGA
jgi:branched-subunit amino acid aminotransferase/4-amino-4-deoxychorismate lyase